MTENQSIELAPKQTSSYADLYERTAAFSPAKLFDMEVDVLSGDTLMSRSAMSDFDNTCIPSLIESWAGYITKENGTATDKAMTAVAHKKISELMLVQMAFSQLTGEVDNSASIEQYEREVYEHYSEGVYRSALCQKIRQLDTYPILDPATNAAKADLLDELELLTVGGDDPESLESPEVETLQAVHDWIHARFGPAFNVVDSVGEKTLNGKNMVAVFNKAIELEPALEQTGWVAEGIVRNKSAVSVRVSEKKTIVPTQRSASVDKVKQLIVHEVYGHALRSANAELDGNEVGRYGTATYASFEESFEVALEQCALNTYDNTRGINHYVAVGLAVSDGKSAQEISRLFESMHQLKRASKHLDEEAVNAARRLTGTQLQRTFAGMTDVDSGIAHRKSIDYLHGLNGSWKLLNYLVKNDCLDDGMNWLLSAKFNPFDAGDRELVNEHHPMPVSLVSFFDSEREI